MDPFSNLSLFLEEKKKIKDTLWRKKEHGLSDRDKGMDANGLSQIVL
jgi:hypothetical protein